MSNEYVYQYDYVNDDSKCKYAIYAVDEPPNKLAFEGRCFVYSKPDDYFSNTGFISEVLNNPTYLDLLHIADEEIKITEDYEHIFFEGIHIIKKVNNNLTQIELILCS
jgi:hypothetical protein